MTGIDGESVLCDEADRLAALASFGILDTPPEAAFDDLAALAAHLCATPMALVTLVDADRQWFKARIGFAPVETSRERSFCAHALAGPNLLVVPDARLDSRFATNPLVTGDPHLRFYAGAPLVTEDGFILGTICVADTVPRTVTQSQRSQLAVLAAQVVSQLELRRQARALATEMAARLEASAALRENQQILAGVLEHTDVLVYAKDLDGRYVMTNPAHEHVARTADGVLRHTDHQLFPADDAIAFRGNDADIVDSRQHRVFIEDLFHPDGSTHTYRSTKFPLLDDEGKVIGIGGVSMDVTELWAARAAHAEAEQRWRELVEQTPVGVAVLGTDGTIVYANPQAVLLCGASTAAEVERQMAMRFIPRDDRADLDAAFAPVFAGGPPIRGRTWTLQQIDGNKLTVEFSASAVTHRGVPALQLELRDVTEAAVAQAELTESERRFRAVFDDSPVAMALLDEEGGWVEVNAAFGDLSGLDPAAVPGTRLLNLVHPDDHHRVQGYLEGRPYGQELRMVWPDGRLRWVWLSTNPTAGPGGEPYTLAAIQDVTARKTAETALQESEADLAAVAAVARCVHTGDDPRQVAVAAIHELSGASTVSMLEAFDASTIAVTVCVGLDAAGHRIPLAANSMNSHVWQTGKALFLADAAADPRVDPMLLALDDSVSVLWQPVVVDGKVEAVFNVTWRHRVSDPAARAVRVVQLVADEAGVALQTSKLRRELERSAATDPLTGALNRRAWHSRLETLTNGQDRAGSALTIAVVDLDNFKAYNDTHGHSAGDLLLRTFAAAARAVLRHRDVFARWGGEEFIFALPDTDAPQAARVLELVQASMPKAQTCSIGYTTWDPAESVDTAITRADDALYRAKNLGRNRLERA